MTQTSQPRPWQGRRFTAYTGDSRSRRVILAVRPIDAFTEGPPAIDPGVYLQERRDLVPIRTAGGYFCFLRHEPADAPPMPTESFTLRVESDPVRQDFYFPATVPVEIPMPDPLDPVKEVRLTPKPSYPFPGSATLIRGSVVRIAGGQAAPVSGAAVLAEFSQADVVDGESHSKRIVTLSDRRGEFVLFFLRPALAEETIQVRVQPATLPPKTLTTKLREGATGTVRFELD